MLRWVCGRPKYCEVLLNDNSKFRAPVATCTGTVLVSLPTSGNDRPQVSGTCEYRIRFAENFSGKIFPVCVWHTSEYKFDKKIINKKYSSKKRPFERLRRQLVLREPGCSSDVQTWQSGPDMSQLQPLRKKCNFAASWAALPGNFAEKTLDEKRLRVRFWDRQGRPQNYIFRSGPHQDPVADVLHDPQVLGSPQRGETCSIFLK